MRTYHRWLALFFAPFLLWIAGTGFAIDLDPLLEHKTPPPAALAPATTASAFHCPETMTCRPKTKSLVSWVKDLHSGAEFGVVGKTLSILCALALLFFASSGMWMYVQMWRVRARRALKPRWFW